MITYWVRPAESTPGHQFLDESMEKASEHRQVHFSDDIAPPDFERKVSWNEAMTVKDGLIDWNVEVLEVLLREIVAVREATNIQRLQMGGTPSQSATAVSLTEPGKSVFEEWKEVIELPAFDPEIALRRRETVEKIILPANVVFQLKDFVSTISHMYRKNAFHNFEVK